MVGRCAGVLYGAMRAFSVKSDAAAADAALTDENPQRLEMVTEMDEEGNITDADDGPRLVEDSGIETFSADDTVKIVNFRTKETLSRNIRRREPESADIRTEHTARTLRIWVKATVR